MLVDHVSNWTNYKFGPVWEEVMTWLAQEAKDHTNLKDGQHVVGGCVINVTSLLSRDRSTTCYEYHRRFCDVQMVLEGEEYFLPHPGIRISSS